MQTDQTRIVDAEPGALLMVGWTDLVGMVRTRGATLARRDALFRGGLGWAAAGHAMTPFGGIAPNQWGPAVEVRQFPVPETLVEITEAAAPPFRLVLAEGRTDDGAPWSSCPRGFLNKKLAILKERHGLVLKSTFEHEFSLSAEGFRPTPATYSFAAYREVAPILHDIVAALDEAGLAPVVAEPEFGPGQVEMSFAPREGARAADEAVLIREIVRDVARGRGARASYSPKPAPDAVGSGMHLHFSLWRAGGDDGDSGPASYDADGQFEMSRAAQSFVAGVVAHSRALAAVAAPSPVSYFRLTPGAWSCGFRSFGVQNRECAVRVCPPPKYGINPNDMTAAARAEALNFEFRIADGACNPYLALGMIVAAGLDGLERGTPLPQPTTKDPAAMSDAERRACDIEPLPTSLGEALDALVENKVAAGFMPPELLEAFVSVKRHEIAEAENMTAAATCDRYGSVY